MTMVILASKSPRRTQLLDMLGVEHRCVPSGVPEEPLPEKSPGIRSSGWPRTRRAPWPNANRGLISWWLRIPSWPWVGRCWVSPRIGRRPRPCSAAFPALPTPSSRGLPDDQGRTGRHRPEREPGRLPRPHRAGTGLVSEPASPWTKRRRCRQGAGAVFIRSIEGSFHNVVGFPIDLFYRLLPDVGMSLRQLRDGR